MRFNSRNSHVFSARLAQRIRLFEALGTSAPGVFEKLKSGQYITWRELNSSRTRKTGKNKNISNIGELYNQASGFQGRGELLIKDLLDADISLSEPVTLGKVYNPWDLFVEGETFEIKQVGPTIVLGSSSSIAAAKLRNNLHDICQQIISFCKSVESSRKPKETRSRLGGDIQMILKTAISLDYLATRSSIGNSYFEDLGQLVTDVINYDSDASELPAVSIDANLTVGDRVYNSRLDNLQDDPKKVMTIKNVLFPDEDLHMLRSAELHHEIFSINFVSWQTTVLKNAVEEAFSEMPENLQGFFLVDPLGVIFVRKDDVMRNFSYSGIVRSRIALVVPKEYRR